MNMISILERLKLKVSFIHHLAKKVPIFGVLPFAGLLDLSTLTMYGITFSWAWSKRGEVSDLEMIAGRGP